MEDLPPPIPPLLHASSAMGPPPALLTIINYVEGNDIFPSDEDLLLIDEVDLDFIQAQTIQEQIRLNLVKHRYNSLQKQYNRRLRFKKSKRKSKRASKHKSKSKSKRSSSKRKSKRVSKRLIKKY